MTLIVKYNMSLTMTKQEIIVGGTYLAVSQLLLPYLIVLIGTLIGGISAPVLNLIYTAVNAAACIFVFRKALLQSVKAIKNQITTLIWIAFLAFLISTIGMYIVSIGIYALLPDFTNGNNEAIIEMASTTPWMMALETIILAPIAEECMFRGILFIPFYQKKPRYGYLISTLAFAAVHVISFIGLMPPQMILLSLLQYIPSGLAFAWACAKTDSLLCPMIAHSAINAFSFLSVLMTT